MIIIVVLMVIMIKQTTIIIMIQNDNNNDNDNIAMDQVTDWAWDFGADMARLGTRKGTNGVSTNGVTADFMFFDRGTYWVLPLTYFYIPKRASAYLFPQSAKINCFRSGPIN